jgi:osmotically-inducible protein OsmY
MVGRPFGCFVAAALIGTALTVAGCRREPDVHARALAALQQAGMTNVALEWDRDSRVLHLKGTVPDSDVRKRAERVVASAIAAAGTVVNELILDDSTLPGAIDPDAVVRRRLNELFEQDAVFKNRLIDIDVHDRVVTLSGNVRSERERRRAYDMANTAPGVNRVLSELRVTGS